MSNVLDLKIIYALFNPLSLRDELKHNFTSPKNKLNFPTTQGLRVKISMKLFFQYVAAFFNFSSTSSHLQPLQVEDCDSNSRLVVDEDDNDKFRLERVNTHNVDLFSNKPKDRFFFSI